MSEKIIPLALSFNTNRYAGIDRVKPTVKNTMVIDADKFDYGDVFEKNKFESGRLYSLEANGKVKGLFESKNGKDFISLTKTFDGGILEKVKNGESVLMARYSNKGMLTDLAEIIGDKITFIERSGKITEASGFGAKMKLQSFIKGIKIV